MGNLKRIKFTKPLILLVLLEILIIELVIFYIFNITPVGISGNIEELEEYEPGLEELMIIVFKKEYFFGKIRVTVKPYKNNTVTLEFPYGKVLNITDEYTFVETLLPGVSRWPFLGLSLDFAPNNYSALLFDEYLNPYYVYTCPKSELEDGFLRPRFLPYEVTRTMAPYYIVTIKGKFYLKTEILGVVPWNKS